MTFHDEVHASSEETAREAARTLQVWLKTIAPVSNAVNTVLSIYLMYLARELEWPTEEDEQLGEIIRT